MRIAYLGEIIQDSYVVWCLKESGAFERIDHFTKPTLSYTHVSMNPQPDAIVIKCDWEDMELEWCKRYSLEIPKIFVACDMCLRKRNDYYANGFLFNLTHAINEKDLMLTGLVRSIQSKVGYNGQDI